MNGTLDIYTDALRTEIGAFTELAKDEHITAKTSLLTKSQGTAINEINDCLKAYETYCNGINDLFAATSMYLKKAMGNIDACEEDNTQKVTSGSSKENR